MFFDYAKRRPQAILSLAAQVDGDDPVGKALIECWMPDGQIMHGLRLGLSMASLLGSVSVVPGVFGPALSITANNYAQNNTLNASFDSVVGCVCVRFLANGTIGVTKNIIQRSTAFGNGLTMYWNSTNVLAAQLNPSAGGAATTLLGTTALVAGKIYHAALVFRSGGRSELYLNGALEAFDNATVTFDYVSQPVALPGNGFANPLNGLYFRADWYSRALSQPEIYALTVDPWKGLRPRRFTDLDLNKIGFSPLFADWADNLTWTGADLLPSDFGLTLTWTDSFFPSFASQSLADTLTFGQSPFLPGIDGIAADADTLTWTNAWNVEPSWADTLTFTDTNSFLVSNAYGTQSDTIFFRGTFHADTGELANGRYRR